MTLNRIAKYAGINYLLLIPLGILGIMYVPSSLIVTDNITETIANIKTNEMLFRGSIISALTVQICNIILVVLLFKLLQHVNKTVAYLMVIFSLLAVPIAFLNEINHLIVLNLLDTNSKELVMLHLDLHQYGIIIAQFFWGLWLFPLGYLIYKSGMIPKFIGILLMIGCMGYVIDSVTLILFPNLGFTFSEFTFLGEIIFPLWLLIKGVKQS